MLKTKNGLSHFYDPLVIPASVCVWLLDPKKWKNKSYIGSHDWNIHLKTNSKITSISRGIQGNAQQEETLKWRSNGGMLIQQIENEWLWKGSRWAIVSSNPALPICMAVTSDQFPYSSHYFIAFQRINLKWDLKKQQLWGAPNKADRWERDFWAE